MRLSDLSPGETALVVRVGGSGAIHRRLLSIGILPGAIVRAVRVSPLGDPIAYEIRGSFISLRRNEADYVEVEKIVPLHLVPPGSVVKVILVDGGVGFIRNLNRMGLSPGKLVEVLRPCCPMLIRTDAGVFNIGRGMAYRIYVR
ncbi:iron transporter FeoA [Euryarchaeota archaeon ex4484_178]|nr:ferrous iron transport protein A [Thermoplasmata archaeon]OYT59086.1 MAG: iron transporter FeoA [Euryarchaeota archaeon ex4484_178]